MKRILLQILTVTLLASFLPASCRKAEDPITLARNVSLNKSSLSLSINGAEQLTATVTPVTATAKRIAWSSSDASVASVDQEGVVTGVAAGVAAISVTIVNGGYSTSCVVTVQPGIVRVSGITLNKDSTSVSVGGAEQLRATVAPADATDKTLSWQSSDASIATVSENGTVTGVAAGTARVTATTNDGGLTASCKVTVQTAAIPVTGVSLNKASTTISVDGSESLAAIVAPANASNKTVSWSSDDNTVATVTDGIVMGVAVGTATITVTTADCNHTATCEVTVQAAAIPVTEVSLNKASTTISVDGSEQLTATVEPANATDKTVSWSSNDIDVATVDDEGVVTGVAAGTAVISVTTTDGNFTAVCVVAVQSGAIAVTGVSLNKSNTTISVEGSETLTATVAPANATDKTVSWSSNAPDVATVDNYGLVTGVSAGTAAITATTTDGNFTAVCVVTVPAVNTSVSVTGVSLNKPNTTVAAGGSEQLTVTIAPANADNRTVSWSSNDTGVATVDNDGLVRGVSAGTAAITATTADGNFTAVCVVTVQSIAVTGVSLDKTVLRAIAGAASEQLTASIAPANATNTNLSWSSNNTGVATVSANGTVSFHAYGEATITVASEDGGFTASCALTVEIGNDNVNATGWTAPNVGNY